MGIAEEVAAAKRAAEKRRRERAKAAAKKAAKARAEKARQAKEDERRKRAAAERRSSRDGRVTPGKSKKNPTGSWKSILFGGRGIVNNNRDFWQGKTAGRGGSHTGEDLGVAGGSAGAPLYMPLPGKVVGAGWGVGGGGAFGNGVLVKLDNGDYMFFAHLQSIGVRKGDTVKAGSYIGKVGNTGTNSHGAHLHMEVRTKASGGSFGNRERWRFVDPIDYLNRKAKNVNAEPEKGSGESSGGSSSGGSSSGGDTTENTTIGGGGGGGVGKVGFSKKDFYADLEAMFGDIDTLLDLDKKARDELGAGKSIQWAINRAVKDKIVDPDRFLTLLNKTAWFKRYGQETTRRLIEEKSKPEIFTRNRDQIKASIAQYAANLGVVLDDATLNRMAREAYVYQWDSTSAQVLDRVQEAAMSGGGSATFTGGEIGERMAELETFARDYGVEMSDADVNQLRNDIFDGLGDQRTRDMLQERSASMYSVFADQIRAGSNLRSLMDPYLRTAADLLELGVEEIDMSDPLFHLGRAFQTSDANSGKIVQRTLADFEKMVRSDIRWQSTDNAKETSMSLATGVLKQMGLM